MAVTIYKSMGGLKIQAVIRDYDSRRGRGEATSVSPERWTIFPDRNVRLKGILEL